MRGKQPAHQRDRRSGRTALRDLTEAAGSRRTADRDLGSRRHGRSGQTPGGSRCRGKRLTDKINPTGGEHSPPREFCPLTQERRRNMARELLLEIIEAFPQADPASEFYNEEINGCEAVNFLSQFIPQIREYLDAPPPKVA